MKNKSPSDAYFAVAKRVPVRMRFEKMDQRKLNHFLAVCGSMKMVLEFVKFASMRKALQRQVVILMAVQAAEHRRWRKWGWPVRVVLPTVAENQDGE